MPADEVNERFSRDVSVVGMEVWVAGLGCTAVGATKLVRSANGTKDFGGVTGRLEAREELLDAFVVHDHLLKVL